MRDFESRAFASSATPATACLIRVYPIPVLRASGQIRTGADFRLPSPQVLPAALTGVLAAAVAVAATAAASVVIEAAASPTAAATLAGTLAQAHVDRAGTLI